MNILHCRTVIVESNCKYLVKDPKYSCQVEIILMNFQLLKEMATSLFLVMKTVFSGFSFPLSVRKLRAHYDAS